MPPQSSAHATARSGERSVAAPAKPFRVSGTDLIKYLLLPLRSGLFCFDLLGELSIPAVVWLLSMMSLDRARGLA